MERTALIRKAGTPAASVPQPSPASRLPQSGARHQTLGDINPVGRGSAPGGDPTMGPARPIHLLRLPHRHRRQAASHSPVPGTRPWATSIRWEGALPRAAIRRWGQQGPYTCCACPTAIAGKPPPTVRCQAPDLGRHQSGGRGLCPGRRSDDGARTARPTCRRCTQPGATGPIRPRPGPSKPPLHRRHQPDRY